MYSEHFSEICDQVIFNQLEKEVQNFAKVYVYNFGCFLMVVVFNQYQQLFVFTASQ